MNRRQLFRAFLAGLVGLRHLPAARVRGVWIRLLEQYEAPTGTTRLYVDRDEVSLAEWFDCGGWRVPSLYGSISQGRHQRVFIRSRQSRRISSA